MDRLSSRPQRHARPAAHGGAPAPKESFSEMAEVTAHRPGVVGKLLVLSLIIVSIAVTAFVGYAIVNGIGSQSYIEEDSYQAVFLSDGQIYFGKLANTDKEYTTLTNIYYLQVQNASEVQQAEGQQNSSIELVKLGNEIHGPQDKMIINSDQILFWENLKADGQVSEAIATYEEEQASGDSTETPAEDAEDTPLETTEN